MRRRHVGRSDVRDPRDRSQRLARRDPRRHLSGVLCAIALVTSTPVVAASSSLDLMGSWYVLIHYRDEATSNPEADRWEDRIWIFEKKGSRLSWTEYPIVIFSDQSGRFERTVSGVQGRVLAAWEPNEKQRRQIAKGLEAPSRGSKTKTLRGSERLGYKSVGGLRTQSVSVIGYHETWSIDGLPDAPVFARNDLMGSGRTANLEGRTQYTTTEVLEGGTLIRGSYQRDGTRHGVFRMMRTGAAVRTKIKKRGSAPKRPYLTVFSSARGKREISALVSRGDALSDEELQQLRARLQKSIGETLRDFGLDGDALSQRTQSLSSQIEVLLLEQGKTVEDLDRMVGEGMIQP